MSLLAVALQLTVILKLLSASRPRFSSPRSSSFSSRNCAASSPRSAAGQLLGGHRQTTEVIEIVIRALEQMQQDGHGALIAFEREITYEPARETGTIIDAQVTDDLLETIFFPKTPAA